MKCGKCFADSLSFVTLFLKYETGNVLVVKKWEKHFGDFIFIFYDVNIMLQMSEM